MRRAISFVVLGLCSLAAQPAFAGNPTYWTAQDLQPIAGQPPDPITQAFCSRGSTFEAVGWTQNHSYTVTSSIAGGTAKINQAHQVGSAFAISNDRATIVGTEPIAGGYEQGWRWTNAAFTDVTLPAAGAYGVWWSSRLWGVAPTNGDSVGQMWAASSNGACPCYTHATYLQHGQAAVTDLGVSVLDPHGGAVAALSYAVGITDGGIVAGNLLSDTGNWYGFIIKSDGTGFISLASGTTVKSIGPYGPSGNVVILGQDNGVSATWDTAGNVTLPGYPDVKELDEMSAISGSSIDGHAPYIGDAGGGAAVIFLVDPWNSYINLTGNDGFGSWYLPNDPINVLHSVSGITTGGVLCGIINRTAGGNLTTPVVQITPTTYPTSLTHNGNTGTVHLSAVVPGNAGGLIVKLHSFDPAKVHFQVGGQNVQSVTVSHQTQSADFTIIKVNDNPPVKIVAYMSGVAVTDTP